MNVNVCSFEDCTKEITWIATYCPRHIWYGYALLRNARRIFTLEEIAAMNSCVSAVGYVNRRLQPGVWVGEHTLVMESLLQTRMPKGASVHHRNGVKADNDPGNLELWFSSQPTGQRVKCPRCGWGQLETY